MPGVAPRLGDTVAVVTGRISFALALAAAMAATLAAGCGSDESRSSTGYVSINEAEGFFRVYYGGRWDCAGHGIPDYTEAVVDAALMDQVERAGKKADQLPYRFVSCRLVSGGGRNVREDEIGPGSVLTYGIP